MTSPSNTRQPNDPIHILIVGTGAIGAFYASRLHQPASSPPTLVSVTCRSNYAAVLANGLSLTTHTFGDYLFKPHKVFRSIDHAASPGEGEPWDFVVLCTKALPDVTDDSAVLAPVIERVDRPPAIVLIQNGVGIEAPHRKRFPHAPLISAITVVSAEQTSPGVIRQNRWTRISLGPFVGDDAPPGVTERAEEATELLAELLKQGGIKDAEVYDEKGLQLVRWHKIAINASMNPSSVLSGGVGNAAMALDPDLRSHLHGCMTEVLTTAPKILGREFPSKFATADQILKSTERNTGAKPSMLLDWEQGRPLEVEVILGNPVRLAREKGLEMPRLQTMYALLRKAQEKRVQEQKDLEAKARL